MRALAIDVGTGTQDVLLFDDEHEIENAFRLVLPSPTVMVAERIRAATARGEPVLVRGSIMGGGPSHWAARDHAAAGLPIAATEDAARTFDDDLAGVRAMGIRVLDDDAAADLARQPDTVVVNAGDLRLDAIAGAFAPFGVELASVDAIVVAVFDHGAAPAGVSDRRFRFARLAERLSEAPDAGPEAFGYLAAEIPAAFTRLQAAARTAAAWLVVNGHERLAAVPIVGIDTGPAAILGTLDDPQVREVLAAGRPVMAVNVGNFHVLVCRLSADGSSVCIDAIAEHHTGELDRASLRALVTAVADGTVDDDAVFRSMGHGALTLRGAAAGGAPAFVAVTGPHRQRLLGDAIAGLGRPHAAMPHADMMQTGNFGGLRALAGLVAEWRPGVERRLGPPAPRPFPAEHPADHGADA